MADTPQVKLPGPVTTSSWRGVAETRQKLHPIAAGARHLLRHGLGELRSRCSWRDGDT